MGAVKERQFFVASIFLFILSGWIGSRFIQAATIEGTSLITACYGAVTLILLVSSLCSWDISRLQPADSHTSYTLITQYIFWRVAIFYGRIVYDSFLAKTANVELNQEEILMQDIIGPNIDTEFGRKYHFKDIHNRDDFRRKVPVMTYADYAPYTSRIESNPEDLTGVLTSSPVKFLAVTSGTTGKNKIIPITSFVRRKAAIYMLSLTMYIISLKSKFTLQRRLRLGYRPRVEMSMSGLKKAPISFFMRRTLPFSPVPAEVYDITDEQEALYIEALIALSERELGHLDGFMSNLVWSFWQIIERNWRQMCDDLEQGKINESVQVEQYIRDAVENSLKPDPARAVELRKEFSTGSCALAQRIWPGLDSVRMITTGAFAHYTSMLIQKELKGLKIINPCHHGSEGIYGMDIWPSIQPENTRYCSLILGYNEFLPIQSQVQVQDVNNPQTLYPEQRCLKPSSKRSEELRSKFSCGFTGIARSIWPNLLTVQMLATGPFVNYANKLKTTYMKGVMQINLFHAASESFMGVDMNLELGKDEQNSQYTPCLPLAYLEFIPNGEQSRVVLPTELEVGKLYEVVVTSPMGLYRYRMGDVVKVVDFFNQCPIYEFQYRTGHVLNCFWEKTTEDVFYKALCQSTSKLHLNLEDYTTTEDITLQDLEGYTPNSDRKHYTLFLEASRIDGSTNELTEEEKEIMDECLCQKMELYKTLRCNSSIGPLHVVEVKRGTFSNLRSHMLSSLSNQQTKMPRVIRSPDLLRQLLRDSLKVS